VIEAVATKTVQPISRAFPAEKAKAWHYKIHPYYTKQPSNVVDEYIRHFCPEGGLVVDPFCGSGVTAIEALTNRRRTVCLDLDPLAVFITRQTCLAPVDLNAFWDAYRQVEEEMEPVVDFVRSASANELKGYELKEWYPKGVKLPSNADRGYVEDLFGRAQLITLAHLRSAILKAPDQQAKELLLFAFSGALDKVSIMYRAPEHGKKHGGGSALFMVYRYWVPKQPAHPDVWNAFTASVQRVANSKKRSNTLFGDFVREDEVFNVRCDSAENLLKYVKKDTVEVDSKIIKDEIPYYKTNLKQLLQEAEKNIKEIDKQIADQKFLDAYEEKADTIREYIAKGNVLRKEGNLEEAKEYYRMALEISKEPEMKKYIKLKNWKGSWLKWK